jgi:hypothetical protein
VATVTAVPQGTVDHPDDLLMVDVNGDLLAGFYCVSQLTKCFLKFRCVTVGNGTKQLMDSLPECVNVAVLTGA